MARVAILTIGDELTSGRVVDRNAGTLASRLRDAGIETPLHVTCGDDEGAILRSLATAHEVADVVITTGGLGPTDDDITHSSIARYLGVELELNEQELAKTRRMFESRGMTMPETNRRQAMLPAGSVVVPNKQGTAPGMRAEKKGKWVITLPGVPRELEPMLLETVIPFLRSFFGVESVVKIRVLKTFGYSESRLAEVLAPIPVPAGLTIGYRPTFPEIHLSLTANADDEATAKGWIDAYEGAVRPPLGPRLWGVDDEEYPAVIGELLRNRSFRLATAESCTGGLVGKLMTDIAGSSEYFERGFITYTNEAKQQLLGVPPEMFVEDGHGAVSEECALAMAEGALEHSEADIALSITGIAGPGGGSASKPVGTVWVGLATPESSSARRYHFPGPRHWVRTLTAYAALERVRRHLLELDDFEPLTGTK